MINILQAQEEPNTIPKIDSLEALLLKKPSEKQKIKIWNQLIAEYQEVNPEKVILYANQIIDYTKSKKNDTLLINAYQTKGNALLETGAPDQAQQNLENALALAKKIKNPEATVYSYAYLGNLAFRTGNIDQGRELYLQGLNTAQKLGDLGLIAKMEKGLAVSYGIQGNYQKSIEGFKKVLKINQKLKDSVQIQANYLNLGVSYLQLGEYNKSRNYFQLTIDVAQKLGDVFQQAKVYTLIAQLNQLQGNDVKALDNYQKALKIFIQSKNQIYIGNVYTNLAQLYYNLNNYDKQLEYISKSLEIYKKSQDKEGVVFLYLSTADTYLEHKKDYQQALDYYEKGLQISLEIGAKANIARAYLGFGNTHYRLKQYQEAKEFTDKAIQLSKEIEAKETLAASYLTFAKVHWDTQQTQQAKQFGEKAFALSQELSSMGVAAESAELLANLYHKQRNYERAYHYHTIYKANSDSLLNEEKIKKITTLENQYQYDQEKALVKIEQEKNEVALKAKIQQQKTLRNAFIMGFVLVLLSAFFILRSYFIKRKANQVLAEKNEQLAEKNDLISLQAEELKITNENLAEMDRFKREITGMLVHDLKSPLSTIIGLTESDFKSENQQIVHQSGRNMLKLVNNMLDVQKLEETEVNLHPKLVHFKNLVSQVFHQVGYTFQVKNIQFKANIPENLTLELDEELIKRVLVNLLDNASKYTPNNGKVSIQTENITEDSDNYLKLSIKDTGVGISPEELGNVFDKYAQIKPRSLGAAHSTGLGLTFCKLAIEAHGGAIGVSSQEGKGSIFWFTLPITDMANLIHTYEDTGEALVGYAIRLTPEEVKLLIPVVEQMHQYEVYEISAINTLLQDIKQENHQNIQKWKNALEESIYASNDEQYKKLLNMILENPDNIQS